MNNKSKQSASNQSRLEKALMINRGKITINRNGYVSLDLNSREVLSSIKSQIKKLEGIKI
ncbi:hypothetical protein [Psychromonas sp. KJ10-2]|uniref:hypothetical protein n=1 Tax=Psychromonas sp. KJ10-2 TaxID=3391822 RepID=UPI0039B3A17F